MQVLQGPVPGMRVAIILRLEYTALGCSFPLQHIANSLSQTEYFTISSRCLLTLLDLVAKTCVRTGTPRARPVPGMTSVIPHLEYQPVQVAASTVNPSNRLDSMQRVGSLPPVIFIFRIGKPDRI